MTMTAIPTTLAADGAVSFLLLITIYYCFMLSRRLRALRADKAELRALTEKLAAASNDAELGIAGLKSAAGEVGRDLDGKLREAQALRDDLGDMLERGGAVAYVLETAIRARREEPKSEPPPTRLVEPARAPTERRTKSGRLAELLGGRGAASRAERELLRALGGGR